MGKVISLLILPRRWQIVVGGSTVTGAFPVLDSRRLQTGAGAGGTRNGWHRANADGMGQRNDENFIVPKSASNNNSTAPRTDS
jgi:hypothetical protein